jgi:hypothetical protein
MEDAPKQDAVLMTFTNHKDKQNLGVLQGLLKMVYHTVLTNRLGIMQAKNSDTDEEEIILVGIEQNGDSINAFPLFAPLKAEDVAKYIAPDGTGGWLEPTPEQPKLELVK